MTKVVLLELNEVPFQVIDAFVKKHPHSQLADMLENSSQFVTMCEDKIQLDPWISWPTLHRGVIDENHQILHLGQSTDKADKQYPPIWKILKDKGLKVGVFGSLHSNQHEDEIQDYAFFLPDFFAETAFAYPDYLRSLQKFNLTMTRKSARNVDGGIPMAEALEFVKSAPKLGIGLDAIRGVSSQLASEVKNKHYRIRRRNTQCTILGDVFIKELKTKTPDFACFYTNHVAAAMHRYWAAAFPEDQIGPDLDAKWLKSYEDEIDAAMKTFDDFLKKLRRFQRTHPDYKILIASSLGQAAIPTQHSRNYLTITDLESFMGALGFESGQWTTAPTMVPDFSIRMKEKDVEVFAQKLNALALENKRMLQTPARMTHKEIQTKNDLTFIKHDVPVGESFKPPMSFDCRDGDSVHINFQWDDYSGAKEIMIGNELVSFSDAGLGFQPHQDHINCSAQHVSDGSLIVYPGGSMPHADHSRSEISTLSIAPSILSHFAIEAPDYMDKKRAIAL